MVSHARSLLQYKQSTEKVSANPKFLLPNARIFMRCSLLQKLRHARTKPRYWLPPDCSCAGSRRYYRRGVTIRISAHLHTSHITNTHDTTTTSHTTTTNMTHHKTHLIPARCLSPVTPSGQDYSGHQLGTETPSRRLETSSP